MFVFFLRKIGVTKSMTQRPCCVLFFALSSLKPREIRRRKDKDKDKEKGKKEWQDLSFIDFFFVPQLSLALSSSL